MKPFLSRDRSVLVGLLVAAAGCFRVTVGAETSTGNTKPLPLDGAVQDAAVPPAVGVPFDPNKQRVVLAVTKQLRSVPGSTNLVDVVLEGDVSPDGLSYVMRSSHYQDCPMTADCEGVGLLGTPTSQSFPRVGTSHAGGYPSGVVFGEPSNKERPPTSVQDRYLSAYDPSTPNSGVTYNARVYEASQAHARSSARKLALSGELEAREYQGEASGSFVDITTLRPDDHVWPARGTVMDVNNTVNMGTTAQPHFVFETQNTTATSPWLLTVLDEPSRTIREFSSKPGARPVGRDLYTSAGDEEGIDSFDVIREPLAPLLVSVRSLVAGAPARHSVISVPRGVAAMTQSQTFHLGGKAARVEAVSPLVATPCMGDKPLEGDEPTWWTQCAFVVLHESPRDGTPPRWLLKRFVWSRDVNGVSSFVEETYPIVLPAGLMAPNPLIADLELGWRTQIAANERVVALRVDYTMSSFEGVVGSDPAPVSFVRQGLFILDHSGKLLAFRRD